MLKKIFGKSENIAQASSTVFIITIISKIISYLESAIVAAYFGTSAEIDMFYLANSISVRFVFSIFAGLSIVVVTMYNNAVVLGGREKGDRFVSSLLAIIIPTALIVTCLLFALAPSISALMTSNYTEYQSKILSQYIRALALVAVLYASGFVLTAVLNANKRFVPGTLLAILQNITLIVFIILLSHKIQVWAVIVGFVFGYVVQGIFLFICVKKIISFTGFSLKKDLDLKKLLLLLFPLILGDASGEINLLVDQFISTKLGEGYVSALSYSSSLDDFVSAFFVQTISSVLLSFFAVLAAEKKYAEMLSKMRNVINIIVLFLLPITIITIFCASDIVSIVYGRGQFNSSSIQMTSAALIGYGLGFIFKTIFIIVRRPFYAIENTKIPMALSMFSVSVNISLTIILGRVLGVFGITVSTTIAFCLGDALAIAIMNKMIPGADWRGESLFLVKILISGLVSAVTVYLASRFTEWNSIISFGMCTILGFVVYLFCLWGLRTKEFILMISAVKRKLKYK